MSTEVNDSLAQIHDIDVSYINKEIVVTLFGRDANGSPVSIMVKNFKPYFYVSSQTIALDMLQKRLTYLLLHDTTLMQSFKFAISRESWKSLYGYSTDNIQLLKIYYENLYSKRQALNLLEQHFNVNHVQFYEANVDHTMRFMIDADVKGFDWIEYNPDRLDCVDNVKVNDNCLRCNAPFRVLSFDIEVEVRENTFPQPDVDRIIVIACALQTLTCDTITEKAVFTLRSCTRFDDDTVTLQSFHTEFELLCAFANYVKTSDADIITGYNISSFDLYFVYNRMRILNIPQDVSNIGKHSSKFSVKKVQNKCYFERYYVTMPGRVVFDVYTEIKKSYKLRSYKLNEVARHFIQAQKDDVHYSEITPLFNGSANDRKRLAEYCLKDAILPLQLMNKLKLLTNAIEMCRVTGLSLQALVNRGQQAKIMSQLLRECRRQRYVVPTLHTSNAAISGYPGALVIEPQTNYYREPIVVLDFASLYPSIMIRHNLCYSTLVDSPEQAAAAAAMPASDYTKTESNSMFVRQHVRKGLLPKIVENLLQERAAVKKAFARETDEHIKSILDGKQLALKICANAVYGFTGAQHGFLPCVSISESVTSYGQRMLRQTKTLIEQHFTRVNGYEFDANVVYGDTDSVFVHFGNVSLARARQLGIEACKIVAYEPPIKLEFEKVYESLLLLSRKKYSGLIATINDEGVVIGRKIDNKGIEVCRRDNCPLATDAQSIVLTELLVNKSPQNAAVYVKQKVENIRSNIEQLSLDRLTISKELKREPSLYRGKQAHVQLALRMRERGDLNTPKVNERVPFVVLHSDVKKSKLCDRVEHPEFYERNREKLKLDVDYYIFTQLYPPLSKILLHVFSEAEINTMFGRVATRRKKRRVASSDIREMYSKVDEK